MSRPQSQHRTSMTLVPFSNTPIRHANSRHHSHTVSLGAGLSSQHRVTRRKSMTSTLSSNAAAFRSAVNGGVSCASSNPGPGNRRSMPVKPCVALRPGDSMAVDDEGIEDSRSSMRMDLDSGKTSTTEIVSVAGDHTISDAISPPGLDSINSNKTRMRRASEGSHLSKGDNKRTSGELRCEKCGKGYKHSSCLTKHL